MRHYAFIAVLFLPQKTDNCYMDIQSLSMDKSQARIQEQAAVKVQVMSLNLIKEQSAALEKLLSSVQLITDTNLEQNINLIAKKGCLVSCFPLFIYATM